MNVKNIKRNNNYPFTKFHFIIDSMIEPIIRIAEI